MEFTIREDQSATQYALPGNPAFWVRVIKPMEGQVTLTSALQGDMTDDEFGAALAAILSRHVSGAISEIRISDISPSLAADMKDHDFVVRRFDFLCGVMRDWAAQSGRRIRDGRLLVKDGQHGALVELE